MKVVQPADRRVIYPRYNNGKLMKCCVPVFLYVGASALAKQSQYIKLGKPFFFTGIADKTATERAECVREPAAAVSPAISMKTR